MTPKVSVPVAEIVTSADRLARSGDGARALTMLNAARSIEASDRDRYEIGEALLRVSNCRLGWGEYNLHPSWAVDRLPGVRRWDGRACQLLIVVADLGFGDTIMALRHIPALIDRAERVVVAVHDALFELVRHAPVLAGTEVISKSQAQSSAWPNNAQWERLFSLPGIVGTREVRPLPAYLQAPSHGPVVPAERDELTVGIAWRSTVRRGFPNRSIPVRLFSQLRAVPNVQLVCLHRDRDLRAIPRGITSVGIRNFADTAAVMSQCNLVVTSDTVTAHLAPALGVPTLVGLRHWPAWIWGTSDRPTRWYECSRLVFQREDETWPAVIDQIHDIVAERAMELATRQEER